MTKTIIAVDPAATGADGVAYAILQDGKVLLTGKGEPFADAPLLDAPPPDPLRRAAESITFATTFSRQEIEWARSHDWFGEELPDGSIIVVDNFTYKGRAYSERIMWGGTFAELRDWAGY